MMLSSPASRASGDAFAYAAVDARMSAEAVVTSRIAEDGAVMDGFLARVIAFVSID
jgi:hypothetical protein